MGVRDAVALQQGADEEMLDKIDRYEASDLPERQKAALRLADVYLAAPGGMTAALEEDLQSHYSGPQIAEIVLKLMQYSSDKIMVSLGLDLEEVDIQVLERRPPTAP
jgi:alkylhydroperoxidase family enzyme